MAASAGGVVSSGVDRSRQMGSMGLSGATGGGCGGSRDRSSDSNGHNTDDETVLSGGEDDENGSNDHNVQGSDRDGKNKARKKKTRTVFSRSQVFQLESTFDIKRYLSSSERAGLAASLQLTETQVTCHLGMSQQVFLKKNLRFAKKFVKLKGDFDLNKTFPKFSTFVILSDFDGFCFRLRYGFKIAGISGNVN